MIPVHPAYFQRVKQTLLLASLLAMVACGKKYETTLPSLSPITESVYASGVVKAVGQYQVYPTVTGQVMDLLVKEGDTVKAGTPLVRIDDRSAGAGSRISAAQVRLLERNAGDNGPVLVQLRESVDQARDRFKLDSANYDRQKALWAQRIGSKSELEQRELAFNTSKAAMTRAEKALVETRDRLRTELEVARNNATISSAGSDDRTPRSLIDGVLYDVMIEPGELATPQKAIAVIGSASDLYLELEVDEYDIRSVRIGQRALVSMDSYSGESFPAEVTRIVPLMDERSRTFRVEARFTGTPPRLFPNLSAEANIILRTKENALTIPASYLLAGDSVLTGPDMRTAVKLGARDMERVEVLEGIDAGSVLYKP